MALIVSVSAATYTVGGVTCNYSSSISESSAHAISSISADPTANKLSSYVSAEFTVTNKTTGYDDEVTRSCTGEGGAGVGYTAPTGYKMRSIRADHIFEVNGFKSGTLKSNASYK